jgi:hypothetical protein
MLTRSAARIMLYFFPQLSASFFFSFLLVDCCFTLPRLPPGSLSARPCSLLLRGVNPLSLLACLTVSLRCATFGETVQEMALTLAAHSGGAMRPIMDLQRVL